jgi:hypothetical protein
MTAQDGIVFPPLYCETVHGNLPIAAQFLRSEGSFFQKMHHVSCLKGCLRAALQRTTSLQCELTPCTSNSSTETNSIQDGNTLLLINVLKC